MSAVDEQLVEDVQVAGEDFFSTPEIEVPSSPPDAHRATVTSVTLKLIESRENWPVVEIGLLSRDLPTLEDKIAVFIPKDFNDKAVALGKKFNPSTLPQATPSGQKSANFWGDQQTMFQRNIANGDKSASLQQFVYNPDSVARKAGKDPVAEGLVKPTTLEQYVENLAKMLVGVECIMTRKERGGDDPAFKHQMQAQRLYPSDYYETNPKAFRKLVLAWENN